MLNFFCVLLKLSEKITLDKVAPLYIFHPKSRIDLKDETRLKFNSEELQKFVAEQNLAFDPKFPTECFHLTIHALQISVNAMIENFKMVKRHISEVTSRIRDLEARAKANGETLQIKSHLKQYREIRKVRILTPCYRLPRVIWMSDRTCSISTRINSCFRSS